MLLSISKFSRRRVLVVFQNFIINITIDNWGLELGICHQNMWIHYFYPNFY